MLEVTLLGDAALQRTLRLAESEVRLDNFYCMVF